MFSSVSRAACAQRNMPSNVPLAKAAAQTADCCMKLRRLIAMTFSLSLPNPDGAGRRHRSLPMLARATQSFVGPASAAPATGTLPHRRLSSRPFQSLLTPSLANLTADCVARRVPLRRAQRPIIALSSALDMTLQ